MAIKTHNDARDKTPGEVVHGVLDGVYPVISLRTAFVFRCTPEGHDYWWSIAEGDAPLDTAARQRLERKFPRNRKPTDVGGYLDHEIIPILAERFGDDGNAAATALRVWAQEGVDEAIWFMRRIEVNLAVKPGEYFTQDGGRAVVLEVHDGSAFGRYRDPDNTTWFAVEWNAVDGRRVDGGPSGWLLLELEGLDLKDPV